MFALNVLLPVALAVAMFTLGLGLAPSDFTRMLARPKAFVVGALLQLVALPVTALAVALVFALPPHLGLGLFVLALCPGGPTSSLFTRFARGDVALSISLTAVITLSSVFTIPVLASFGARFFLGEAITTIDVSSLALFLLCTTLIPVMLAMLLKARKPALAAKVEPHFVTATLVILVAFVMFALLGNLDYFLANVGALALSCSAVLALMLAIGLAVGRLMRLERGETTAVSIDTALQNGAMGIAVATMMHQGDGVSAVAIPAGVYGLMMYAFIVPFALWRRSL
ncbi:MAG: hypothetical protein MUC58_04630 [Rhizobiaceae bacterium]|jgi:BASS family bile acid:Na+ symporter|nr:hypothetical protein [Rhizobiaceae bacterium]